MCRTNWKLWLTLLCLAGFAVAADDVVSAVRGSVKSVNQGARTVVVKTSEGTEHTLHFVGRTVSHGAHTTGKDAQDALRDVKEGDDVVVHYTVKGSEKTAEEVDHIGKEGLRQSEGAVESIDRGAKTITVKTKEGAEETFRMGDAAAKETGKGLQKAGKVTVYYSEEAGKKVAHFFKAN